MVYFVLSIAFTLIFYIVASYMSYITASILHRGIIFRLIIPTVKAVMFITIVYTSIIADIVLFSGGKYETVAFKNGVMSTVVVTSLTTNKGERGRKK
ncbi:membrane protein [Bacillus phage Chotacabras]|nr:membrane protein [Bacillus phage Chotacabras]